MVAGFQSFHRVWHLLACLGLALALGGCAHIQLVAPYDATIDRELTALLSDTTSFVSRMNSRAGTPDGEYSRNTDFYDNAKGRVAVLVARAEASRVTDRCPSTRLMALALDKAKVPANIRGDIGTPPQGDCDVVLVEIVARQFERVRRFHQAQGALGLPVEATGPLLEGGLGASIRAALAVQLAKSRS